MTITEPTSAIKDRGLTEQQARDEIHRLDRNAWFPSTHGSGEFGIISGRDGREVARFAKKEDRDFVVELVRKRPDARPGQ